MPGLTLPFSFVAKTRAKASEVNANFQAIKTLIEVTKLGTDNIQDNAITAALIAANAVGPSEIASLPMARVFSSEYQDVPNNTDTTLAFNTERFDTDAIHDISLNNSRLTCKTAGVYLIGANINWAQSGSPGNNRRDMFLLLNAGTHIAGEREVMEIGETAPQSTATIYKLAVNDYVEVTVKQNGGTTGGIRADGNYSPEFWMAYLGKG